MAAQSLTGLADLMRLLTTPTSPAAVLQQIITGPLTEFHAAAGILMQGVEDHLVMVASYGYAPGDLAGFETMPMGADLPICRAYREGEPVITSMRVIEEQFEGLRGDPARWDEFRERAPRGSIVSVPLVSQGVAIGSLGFSCSEERDWGAASFGMLDCLTSAVAIWMAHPVSGLATEDVWVAAGPITLTERQQQVLLLWAGGRSTVEIATALAYSESTVKQEMRRILRALETVDRATAVQRARSVGLIEEGAR